MAALTSFAVRGFQSYHDEQKVTIAGDLTLVAGRNNVGKSALLRAMRVFVEGQEGARADFQITYAWRLTAEELLALTLAPGETSVEYEQWVRSREERELVASYGWDGQDLAAPNRLFLSRLELPADGRVASGGTRGAPQQWTEGEWGGDAYVNLLMKAPHSSFVESRS